MSAARHAEGELEWKFCFENAMGLPVLPVSRRIIPYMSAASWICSS